MTEPSKTPGSDGCRCADCFAGNTCRCSGSIPVAHCPRCRALAEANATPSNDLARSRESFRDGEEPLFKGFS